MYNRRDVFGKWLKGTKINRIWLLIRHREDLKVMRRNEEGSFY